MISRVTMLDHISENRLISADSRSSVYEKNFFKYVRRFFSGFWKDISDKIEISDRRESVDLQWNTSRKVIMIIH